MTDAPNGTTVVFNGGQFIAEISRATAPTGLDKGYLTRAVSQYATAGCTCGWWGDGLAEKVQADFGEHVESHQ